MSDKLRLDYINSLPQPFIAKFSKSDKYGWPIYDIDVETGLMRIDVCGKLDVKHFCEVIDIEDESGVHHDPETFWTDWQDDAEVEARKP